MNQVYAYESSFLMCDFQDDLCNYDLDGRPNSVSYYSHLDTDQPDTVAEVIPRLSHSADSRFPIFSIEEPVNLPLNVGYSLSEKGEDGGSQYSYLSYSYSNSSTNNTLCGIGLLLF